MTPFKNIVVGRNFVVDGVTFTKVEPYYKSGCCLMEWNAIAVEDEGDKRAFGTHTQVEPCTKTELLKSPEYPPTNVDDEEWFKILEEGKLEFPLDLLAPPDGLDTLELGQSSIMQKVKKYMGGEDEN